MKPKCIIPGCERSQSCRGLCLSCRASASQAIGLGKTTEDELIRLGLMLPRKSIRQSSFMDELRNKRKQQTGEPS